MLPLTMILVVARGGVIGRNGRLPFDVPEDRAFFLERTAHHAVIMGHATFDETGRPLPDRRNLVVSRSTTLTLPGAEVFGSIEAAIAAARTTDPEPYVIGGARIFELAMPYVTRVYLTEIDRTYEGDTVFDLDRSDFREIDRRRGEDPDVVFLTFERRSSGD